MTKQSRQALLKHAAPLTARVCLTLFLAATASNPVFAQRPDSLTGELRQTFREVTKVYERPDGRVMILDAHDMQVFVADFRSDECVRVGRQGMAEGEYLWPSRLFPLPGDTTLVWDAIDGRIHVLTEAQGTITVRATLQRTDIRRSDGTAFNPMMSDALGRLYTVMVTGDSSALLRLDRTSSRVDTVAVVQVRRGVGGQMLRTYDRWVVGATGAAALVRVAPYRVDFYPPDSPATVGSPIPFTPTQVTQVVRSAWLEVMHRPRPAWSALGGGRYGFIDQTKLGVEYGPWPLVMPPVLARAFIGFASNGSLLIERLALPGIPSEYDVVDTRGQLADRFQLPAGSQIVATGQGSVFVTVRGPDDRLRLQRFSVRSGR